MIETKYHGSDIKLTNNNHPKMFPMKTYENWKLKHVYLINLLIRLLCSFLNTAISRKVVGKKASKCTRQDRKVVWVFTGILHIGTEEIYKFVFLHVENLFFLSGGLYL